VVVALQPAVGLALDLLLVAALGLDVVGSRRAGAPAVRLDVPRRIALGDDGSATVTLANRDAPRFAVGWVIDLPRALAGAAADDVGEVVLPRGTEVVRPLSLAGRARGRFALGPLHVRVAGPLGLVRRQCAVPVTAVVEVVPGLREVRAQRRIAAHTDLVQSGLHRLRQLGHGRAFESLREYVRGDDPRRLDWKATARHGRLIVRQHEAERSQTVMICVDAGRLMAERCGDRQRLDFALASALVLAEVAHAWRDRVGVLVFSDRRHLLLPPGRRDLGRLPSLLATVEARPVEPDYPSALATVGRTLTGRGLIVVFSDAVDAEVSAALAGSLAHLGRRHLALLIALRNPALMAAAAQAVTTPAGAYRRAAAAELVAARARALGGMREAGVRVADVAPEHAVPETVRRYLDVKRRGLV